MSAASAPAVRRMDAAMHMSGGVLIGQVPLQFTPRMVLN